MIEFFKKTDINFMGTQKICFPLSAIAVFIGLVALIQIGRGAARLGIDFAGGTALALQFQHPIKIDALRNILGQGGFGDAELQEVTSENKLLIRLKKSAQNKRLEEVLSDLFEKNNLQNPFVVIQSTEIGPKVGRKLQKDTLMAIALSLVGILFYLAVRFEFRFGVAAAIATFHDVLVLLGLFYLLDKEITLLIVTALLTIAGYSLSDTVVVFDRIRENVKAHRKEPFAAIINRSINEIIARTFNTGFSTLLAVAVLLFFGGEVLHDFALAMTLGVLVGTYSSWFIASPLLIWLKTEAEVLKRA